MDPTEPVVRTASGLVRGRRATRIFHDAPDVTRYPEQESMYLWDQHRFGVLDLISEPAR